MTLEPCGMCVWPRPRMAPMLSEGKMKPRPMRPKMAQLTSSAMMAPGRLRSMVTMSANEVASNARPMLTNRCVGWRSARRPTMAMVTASTRPAGSKMPPTYDADKPSPICM